MSFISKDLSSSHPQVNSLIQSQKDNRFSSMHFFQIKFSLKLSNKIKRILIFGKILVTNTFTLFINPN